MIISIIVLSFLHTVIVLFVLLISCRLGLVQQHETSETYLVLDVSPA